jgi:hypothetical protein
MRDDAHDSIRPVVGAGAGDRVAETLIRLAGSVNARKNCAEPINRVVWSMLITVTGPEAARKTVFTSPGLIHRVKMGRR